MTSFQRVVITGAAGNLGAKLARHLAGRYELVLLDRPDGDLASWDSRWVTRFERCDAVVHLAGNPIAYDGWDELTGPNIDAVLNVFEAAARGGARRLLFASSNHAMGGYQEVPDVPITPDLPPRPGTRYVSQGVPRDSGPYGATKLFGERIGRHYAAARQMEVICIRLGWVWKGDNTPAGLPKDRDQWFHSMWLSDRDYLHLMDCCLAADLPEPFLIVNGMSNNSGMRWDLASTTRAIGFHPLDNVRQSAT